MLSGTTAAHGDGAGRAVLDTGCTRRRVSCADAAAAVDAGDDDDAATAAKNASDAEDDAPYGLRPSSGTRSPAERRRSARASARPAALSGTTLGGAEAAPRVREAMVRGEEKETTKANSREGRKKDGGDEGRAMSDIRDSTAIVIYRRGRVQASNCTSTVQALSFLYTSVAVVSRRTHTSL